MLVQGHFQIFFNSTHTPMLNKQLSLFMKLMYCSGVWSYVVGAIATPTFIIIPLVSGFLWRSPLLPLSLHLQQTSAKIVMQVDARLF